MASASASSSYMPPWLLALIVLLLSCAVGAYYAGGKWAKGLVPEGFSAGSIQAFKRKQAQAQCDTDFNTCINAGTDIGSCTTIYTKCVAAASAADTDTSTAPSAPSNVNQGSSSAVAAIAAAKAAGSAGDLASGDTTTSAEYQAELKSALSGAPVTQTDAYKALLASLASRTVTDGSGGAKPTADQLALAQGDGGSGSGQTTGTYTPNQDVIAAHVTPDQLKALITAKLASDAGTQAQKIQEDSILTPSVRSQIRNDVKKTIRDEIDAVNNEYEIQYD